MNFVRLALLVSLFLPAMPTMAEDARISSGSMPRELTPTERLVVESHRLSLADLDYKFGSNSPERGGMDCSGTVQFLLGRLGIGAVPRTAYAQYSWLKEKRLLKSVPRGREEAVLRGLAPGHLLFWKGTYRTSKPITHVMIYMGTDRRTGKPLVFGARSSRLTGLNGSGVDFFELKTDLGKSSRLVAVGAIPGFEYLWR